MARPSDHRLPVLHVLVLRGHGDAAALAHLAELDSATVHTELAALTEAGLAAEVTGALTGWAPTPAGRREHRRLLGDELAGRGGHDKVVSAYRRFREQNRRFLEICRDWDVRGGTPNDHADAAYDASVVARLHEVDAALQVVLDDVEVVLPRFRSYRRRFATAIAHVDEGARDWFTKPAVDSYHTVWFQLHEDLLATLDLERSQEEPP